MLIQQKSGNINSHPTDKTIDWLELEWHESNKRILHKTTTSGKEVIMKFLKENQQLTQGDIIFEDGETIICIEIKSCEAIVTKPKTMLEMAAVCYEIGNKHLPLFYEKDELLIPYEEPVFNLLVFLGYDIQKAIRKLINPLKTSVASHVHIGPETLFSKITKVPTPAE